MTAQANQPADPRLVSSAMASFLQIGVLLIVLVWCYEILSPFIQIIIWAVIIAVALYPLHVSLSSRFGGREKLSATLLALIGVPLIVAPAYFLTDSTVGSLEQISEHLKDGTASIPAPSAKVADWPLIGPKVFESVERRHEQSGGLPEQVRAAASFAEPGALGLAGGVVLTVLQFIASFIIAGVLLTNAAGGNRMADAVVCRLVGAQRGTALAELSTLTIRSVAKGILGIAFVQAFLAAIGLVVMDVPAAGLWAAAVLVAAIVQLPPILVLGPIAAWVFSVADPLPATVFLVYSILVGLSDALLKPLFLGRGVEVPMLVILLGAIGGAMMNGPIGLFVGAVVLAVGYQILMIWLAAEDPEAETEASPRMQPPMSKPPAT